jgi:hypothetical protein
MTTEIFTGPPFHSATKNSQLINTVVALNNPPTKIIPVDEQARILVDTIGDLIIGPATYDEQITAEQPPEGMGWFLLPRWKDIGSNYTEAVDKILTSINPDIKVRSCLPPFSSDDNRIHMLGQNIYTAQAFREIGKRQEEYKLLAVPCQFGMSYKGLCDKQAERVAAENGEFHLGAFAVACMILTNRQLAANQQLGIKCAGDNFFTTTGHSHIAARRTSPIFIHNKKSDRFEFGLCTSYNGNSFRDCGYATGRLR